MRVGYENDISAKKSEVQEAIVEEIGKKMKPTVKHVIDRPVARRVDGSVG